MTTQTLTLSDFLLARIAEDGVVAHEVLQQRQRLIAQGSRVEDPDTRALEIWEDGPSPFVSMSAERLRAECRAKRVAIEAAWADEMRIESEWGAGRGRSRMERDGDHPDVLVALAQPYADHPDFRDEWRA